MKFRKLSTGALTLYFVLLAYGLGLLWVQLKPKLLWLSPIMAPLIVFLFFFLQGCAGLVWFIRKEAVQLIPLRGKPAQLLGAIVLIWGWGLAIFSLWMAVFGK